MANILNIDIQCQRQNLMLRVKEKLNLNGILGIIGHSGSGKTTLLRTIAGLEKNSDGFIKFDDTEFINSENKQFIASENRQVSLVFQDARLFPHLSVRGNLQFAVKRCRNSQLNIDDIIQLTEISNLVDREITQLSAGEKQRVALARAILSEPKLLLLDEPLSALDNKSKASLLALLKKINLQLALPMIYVSHQLDELQYLADDLLTLENGQVVFYGQVHDVIHQLNSTGEIKQQTSLSLPLSAIDKKYELLSLQLDNNHTIQLPFTHRTHFDETETHTDFSKIPLGQDIRCTIYANDISITVDEPINSSIVNKVPATIIDITQEKNQVLLTLQCGNSQFFASISLFSFDNLQLTKSQTVYMQFKASAVHTYTRFTC